MPTPTPTNALDPKKTCNLESYLDWSARLRTLVANEVLLVSALMRIITMPEQTDKQTNIVPPPVGRKHRHKLNANGAAAP